LEAFVEWLASGRAPCRCPTAAAAGDDADADADQPQHMVALLIDGLRYGAMAPTTSPSTG
jgi:hypothetical protein